MVLCYEIVPGEKGRGLQTVNHSEVLRTSKDKEETHNE